MAKDKSKKWSEGQEVAAQEALPEPVQVTPAAPAPVKEAPAPQQVTLKDAARRLVPGYKEHWWPGIRAHANVMGFGERGTLEQCRAVLKHWGAKI